MNPPSQDFCSAALQRALLSVRGYETLSGRTAQLQSAQRNNMFEVQSVGEWLLIAQTVSRGQPLRFTVRGETAILRTETPSIIRATGVGR